MKKVFILLSLAVVSLTTYGMNGSCTDNETGNKSKTVMSLQELKEYFSQLSTTLRDICKYTWRTVLYDKDDISSDESNNTLSIASYNLMNSLLYNKVFQENQNVQTLFSNYKKTISTDKLNATCQRSKYYTKFIEVGLTKYPLHRACKENNEIIVKWLLELGADANAENTCKDTPLHYACEYSSEKIVKLLIEHRAKVNVHNDTNETPLHCACENGHEEIVKLLIEHGADVNKENNFGEIPLFAACENGHEKVVKLLIEHGADVNKENNFGEIPLKVAQRNGNENIIKYLINRGAKEYFSNRNFGWIFFLNNP